VGCLPPIGQGVAIGVSIQRIFGGSEDIIEQHGGETAVRGGHARPVLEAQLGTGCLAIQRQIDAR
jgi:hydroxyethylthiazole kinase-like sugar kinase family protein